MKKQNKLSFLLERTKFIDEEQNNRSVLFEKKEKKVLLKNGFLEKAEKISREKKNFRMRRNLNFDTEVPGFESQPRIMSFVHYKE